MNNIEMLSKREELSDAELDGANGGLISLKELKADLANAATAAITAVVYVYKKVDGLLK